MQIPARLRPMVRRTSLPGFHPAHVSRAAIHVYQQGSVDKAK
jgi:hypothetical protein